MKYIGKKLINMINPDLLTLVSHHFPWIQFSSHCNALSFLLLQGVHDLVHYKIDMFKK